MLGDIAGVWLRNRCMMSIMKKNIIGRSYGEDEIMQGKRWRVLIVDDEFRIGKLIEKLIHWDEFSLECAAVMTDGESAFRFIQGEEKPDIVITDIRMPGMNGLELICRSQEIDKDIQFIVISGYKEFEYAHKALQYGVEDYLLKPINEGELNHVLEKLSQGLGARRRQMLEREELQETVSRSRRIIKRDFLRNIIELEEETDKADSPVELEGSIYRGIDIKLDYVDFAKREKKQDSLTVKRIIEIVEKILKSEAGEVFICEKENLHIYGLFNYDYSRSKRIKMCLNNILTEIQDYLLGFEQYEVTIGVGSERMEFGEIRFSIKEAYRAVGNRIYLGVGRLIYTENIAHDVMPDSDGFVTVMQDRLRTSIESYSVDNLENCINQIYGAYIMQKELDFSLCYDLAEEIVQFFFEHFDASDETFGQIKKRILENCQHCTTISKLKNLLKTKLGECLKAGRESAEAESAKPIRLAMQYIEEHYREKMALEDLAELVGLNEAYFSTLFKKETGINYSTYLVNVRMEKAKKLLCTTNETIAAVGELVGYKDSRYFSQMFAKQVGIKPALYRKLHS